MQIIIGIVIIAIAWRLLELYWVLLLLVIIGTLISGGILAYIQKVITKNKTEEEKKSYDYLFCSIYSSLLFFWIILV